MGGDGAGVAPGHGTGERIRRPGSFHTPHCAHRQRGERRARILLIHPRFGHPRLRSGEQRFHEGPLSFRFPRLFSGDADVHEWYDDDTDRFHIEVDVRNRRWGPLFGYRGSFTVEWWDVSRSGVPADVLPVRVEGRE